jgi:hypothetical protein
LLFVAPGFSPFVKGILLRPHRRSHPNAADEARRRARIEFGAVERLKEEAREARGLRLVDEFSGDLRYGWRQLVRTPSFSLLAVTVLAVGIGANTVIFSAIDAVLLQSLPV